METFEKRETALPALKRCLLVDSRFRSRTVIAQDLRVSGLFNSIIEAASLSDGLSALETQEIDACFIGPFLSRDKAAEFVRLGIAITKSKQCAFFVFTQEVCSSAELFKHAGAHGILKFPYDRRSFRKEVVCGVVAADSGGVWARFERGKTKERSEIAEFMFRSFSGTADALKELAEGVSQGELNLNTEGKPCDAAERIISRAVVVALRFEGKSDNLAQFGEFLHRSISQWFVELIKSSKSEATQKLRSRLTQYSDSHIL